MLTPAAIIMFVVMLLLCGGAAMIYANHEDKRRKKMIELVQDGAPQIAQSSNSPDEKRAAIVQKLKDNKSDPEKEKQTIKQSLEQAGLDISIKKYWIYASLLAVFLTLLLFMMGQSPFIVICGFITSLLGLPKVILGKMASSRQSQFLEEFPVALESVVRLLKSGMPVSEAVSMGAKEFPGPVGEEMARMYDQQKVGIPLHIAAKEACQRMPLTEMNMFATSLAIQAQTGSSLSQVLMNLSSTIRSRFRLKRKIKALSSEAIASASIIGALPILVAGGMFLTNKEYISLLFTDPFGKVLLFGAIFWMCIGVVMMKIMINFKV